ncbi:cytochrome p450 : Cytochrome P450 family protein OS=Hyphomicrobium denitrificans 1NES1 GN=HYPDE_29763 PE=3 SV=1: p450 [Gemmataceae bacterium]|nr:cytochrome p450 : Cytochrome P450 family protein OS=Hyphomicrobium denitrificans 1NES1 GN=HYPDE_29763 PE=3 SV=1: p450 [Gemmataceae bacterium]VTT98372.1 cytochrome p450 : Cytochrome P450 family protein OS=Hyphomicrobium denitrificans 1NES1 GN=HYPDE_29763 PE=3 SV=1: p450 [Gemmataceae bacterium]
MPSDALPPGPKGTLIAGNLREFARDRLDFYVKLAREYGDLSSFRFGPFRRVFLANHPDLIEQVLVTDAKHYIKHFGARNYMPVLGNGLVTSEGDFWLRQRRLSQPAFLKQRVLDYAPVMTDLTNAMLARWRTGTAVSVHTEFGALTSAIALKTLFGLDDPGDRAAFVERLRAAFLLLTGRFEKLVNFPLWVPTPHNVRIRRAVAHLRRVVDGFIATARARKEPGNDLLSRLVAAQDHDGSRMTEDQIRDEAMTLYLAGHETTALTLAWSWFLLAKHPDAERKLVEEWARVLGGRAPTTDDLHNLPYTDAVLAESMRVYPAVYLIGREATKDLELGGYRVRKGYTVFMSQWVTHRDPRYFGPDPDAFRPERWLDGLAKRLPKYAYFPFGGGPRVCIGNTFALMEAAIILATVGQRYRFTVDTEEVGTNPQITLLPANGIPATLQAR